MQYKNYNSIILVKRRKTFKHIFGKIYGSFV